MPTQRSKYPWGASPRRLTTAPLALFRRGGRLCPPKHCAAVSFRASPQTGVGIRPRRARRRRTPKPPSVREAARSAGGRDVVRPHPRCSSVGGDAHAVERSGTSTLGVHCPAVFASYSGRTEPSAPTPGFPAANALSKPNQRPKAATYLCRFAAKARFDNRPLPRVGFPKGRGRTGRKPSERKIV